MSLAKNSRCLQDSQDVSRRPPGHSKLGRRVFLFGTLVQLFQLGFMKQKCGDMVAAKTYFDKLEALSADCGCGCDETTDPVKFVAWT